MKKLILLMCFGALSQTFFAQEFGIDLQLRPRAEYRHGFKTLVPDAADAGRSHDAFIATYQPNSKNRLDLGLALNEEDETLFKTDYDVNNYKAFQYAWYHTSFDDLNLSLLALNTGFTFYKNGKQEVDY